ncbi:TM2 domain-containing protein [Bacillus luteolus]|uniref:TM2 domain-containing protein n=1 Tax=Litchfieldia luteola TaxID=682179 RepID=A0ABR9QFG6_9BACI|nr:TM2 domain-containing protein [Cytobacillus luteolus]
MNAGGGGGGSSSSSSSSSSSGAGEVRRPVYTKSRVTAGVLAILLGGIGIHKFYLGKSGLGILYLVFCWTYIPAIIGLIEGIAYLLSNDESFAVKHDKGYRMV